MHNREKSSSSSSYNEKKKNTTNANFSSRSSCLLVHNCEICTFRIEICNSIIVQLWPTKKMNVRSKRFSIFTTQCNAYLHDIVHLKNLVFEKWQQKKIIEFHFFEMELSNRNSMSDFMGKKIVIWSVVHLEIWFSEFHSVNEYKIPSLKL